MFAGVQLAPVIGPPWLNGYRAVGRVKQTRPPEAWWCNVARLWLSAPTVQRSVICKKAIVCGLNPHIWRARKAWRARSEQVISVGGQHCCSFRAGHPFSPDGPLEACSTPPCNADIRSELHDVLECKWCFKGLVRVLRLPAFRRISCFRTVRRPPTYGIQQIR
jgi:hypothetical protein